MLVTLLRSKKDSSSEKDETMNSVQRVSFNTNFIGGTLSIIASVLCNVGIVLQKQSHARNAKDDKTLKYANATWLWGIIFQLLGGIVDFEALTYATQELVALVGGSSTVLIGAVCSFLIEDNVAPRITDLFGILVLLIAVVCAAYGSPAEHSFYTLEELEQNFFKPHFVRYAIAVSLFTFFLLTYATYVSVDLSTPLSLLSHKHVTIGTTRNKIFPSKIWSHVDIEMMMILGLVYLTLQSREFLDLLVCSSLNVSEKFWKGHMWDDIKVCIIFRHICTSLPRWDFLRLNSL